MRRIRHNERRGGRKKRTRNPHPSETGEEREKREKTKIRSPFVLMVFALRSSPVSPDQSVEKEEEGEKETRLV